MSGDWDWLGLAKRLTVLEDFLFDLQKGAKVLLTESPNTQSTEQCKLRPATPQRESKRVSTIAHKTHVAYCQGSVEGEVLCD